MPLDVRMLMVLDGLTILFLLYFAIFVYPHRELSEETRSRHRSFVSNAVFREFWYFTTEPFKRKLVAWGTHPNTITLWGLIFSVGAGVLFSRGRFGLGGWCVILASTCDIYDGMLARARKIELKSGAYFDSTLDRVGEVAIFMGLLFYFKNEPFWLAVIYVLATASGLVSYFRARAEGLGFGKAGLPGFFQRAERMIVMSIGMSIAPVVDQFTPPGTPPHILVYITLFLLCAGSVQTAISRFFGIYAKIRSTET